MKERRRERVNERQWLRGKCKEKGKNREWGSQWAPWSQENVEKVGKTESERLVPRICAYCERGRLGGETVTVVVEVSREGD